MVNHSNQSLTNIQFTWQSILWRLALTALLLLILAGFGVTIFNTATTRPEARVLPTLMEARDQGPGIGPQYFPDP